jgi:hypothetical protein
MTKENTFQDFADKLEVIKRAKRIGILRVVTNG